MTAIRVGTRASLLALTQTRAFVGAFALEHPGVVCDEVTIETAGDVSTAPLSESTTPGLFVNALREALLANEVDFIVHSMKDLPAIAHPEIVTACVPQREDARDGLVSRGDVPLDELPPGSVIGTSSPRRGATLRKLRPDLDIRSIRGNIDTRIAKVERGDYAATLLAMAGLNRINRADRACQVFEARLMVPAAGQGALAVECRADDADMLALLAALDHAHTRLTTTAERAVLRGLQAGCATAIGAWATHENGELQLVSELAVEQTGEAFRVALNARVDALDYIAAEALGREAASQLLANPVAQMASWA